MIDNDITDDELVEEYLRITNPDPRFLAAKSNGRLTMIGTLALQA